MHLIYFVTSRNWNDCSLQIDTLFESLIFTTINKLINKCLFLSLFCRNNFKSFYLIQFHPIPPTFFFFFFFFSVTSILSFLVSFIWLEIFLFLICAMFNNVSNLIKLTLPWAVNCPVLIWIENVSFLEGLTEEIPMTH